jgi:hypothetical protein
VEDQLHGRREARIVGLSITAVYVCMLLAAWGLFVMPLQIATASFALPFVATLILSSHRFLGSRASNLNRPIAARLIQ